MSSTLSSTNRFAPADRGVGHQNVESPQLLHSGGNQIPILLAVRHVRLQDDGPPAQGSDLPRDLFRLVGVAPVVDGNVRTPAGHLQGATPPDPPIGARDQGDFA